MNGEVANDLLIHALALHEQVVSDPMRLGPETEVLVARARSDRGTPEALVVALRAQAAYERARLGHARARLLLNEAARLAQQFGLPDRLREVVVARAVVNLELGHLGAARRDLDRAAASGGNGDIELDLQQASLLYNVGRLTDAAQVCRRILGDPRTPSDTEARVANNLGLIEVQLGRPAAALALLDRAEGKAGPALAALVSCSRGWVLARAGRLAESLCQFDEAERRYQSVGLPAGELQMEQLDTLIDLRLTVEARELAERASREFAAHGVALMGAEALLRLAQATLLVGDTEKAANAAKVAAAAFRAQRRAGWAARADVVRVLAGGTDGAAARADLTTLRRAVRVLERHGMYAAAADAHLVAGRLAGAVGRGSAAREHFRSALSASRRGTVLVRLKGHLAGALLAADDGDDARVLRQARAGLVDLARHRDAFASMELRALAAGHGVELGRIGLRAVLRARSPSDVLMWMDRTRGAALLKAAAPVTTEVREQLAALVALQTELEQARQEGLHEPEALLTAQAEIENSVRRATWRHAGGPGVANRVVDVAAVRRLLAGRPMVAYGLDDGVLFAVVLGARRTRLVVLGPAAVVRAESDALLFALRRLSRPGRPTALAAARSSAEHALTRLRALLLEPLGIDSGEPLVVVPNEATRLAPWSALHAAPVVVAPSMSAWARTAAEQDRGVGRTVLVAGPGLPGAVAEVAMLAAMIPSAEVLVPPRSTVDVVTAALPGADLAHFACHGLLRADNPTFSALRLAGGDMTLHQLDIMGRTPRRVVLASCESATNVGYDGDEVLGFVSALMARGTAGIVASVAPVGDVEAAVLTAALHSSLQDGHTVADALHAARAEVDVEDSRCFVNWCAMTAFGAA